MGNFLIAVGLLGLLGGAAFAAWGAQGRELGHGLAVLLGSGVAVVSLVLLTVGVIIKYFVRK